MSSVRKQYPFDLIEKKWQQRWDEEETFRAWGPGESIPADHPFAKRHNLSGDLSKESLPPKYYILDMFPYPSGAGLHVGHPEGYTATDILSRYQRAKGRNVLHPMGWDAFGLPAEQYAIKTGQHPRITTEANVANFTRQINSIGFSYDWTREVNTTDPNYFKWSQWIFLKLYNSWFNPETNKAEPIETLEYPAELEQVAQASSPSQASDGNEDRQDACATSEVEAKRREFRDFKRLAYVAEAPVNWCPELGTVLANEEVIDGKSEVGGHPVVRKPMRQWMLRITAFAERLLEGLDQIEWSDSLKEMQRNWIGRSEGAEVRFLVVRPEDGKTTQATMITVFTTRPDTLFGATYMVLSPEHKLVSWLTSVEQREAVKQYQDSAAGKSDLERTELSKEKSGVFTGAYAINPVNGERIPIWIADYVLAGYGTGAIMAVPAHDERDFEFAKKFGLPIRAVVMPTDNWLKETAGRQNNNDVILAKFENTDQVLPSLKKIYQELPKGFRCAFPESGNAINSENGEISLNGLPTPEAKAKITAWLEEKGLGEKTVNYKLRDWLFSRQRYWGEPFPIIWKDGNHEALPESELPVLPPALEDYKPTPDGEPPLARAKDWVSLPDGSRRETNTMPQWAGSCWYYLRYLDAQNGAEFCSKKASEYWMGDFAKDKTPAGVDLYVGGTEHAVLHLLYARFWHQVLFDLGYVTTPEPFYKLVNQGLILGEDGQKMSKSRGNVVNPDDILSEYGADPLRLYEMFMGPLEMVKPWSTKGVEGVYRFLGRVWRLFIDEGSQSEFEQTLTTNPDDGTALLKDLKLSSAIQEVEPTAEQLKTLHACIKKVTEDLDGMRFNTAISAMMIFTNDAMGWDVKPRSVLRTFLQLLQPFAPHIAEELFEKIAAGENICLSYEPWPTFDASLLEENTVEMPVQVNGKLRDRITVSVDTPKEEIEKLALAAPKAQPFLEGKEIKKIIVVPKKLINIAVK